MTWVGAKRGGRERLRAPVLGAEDVVLQKLRWFALTGSTSERQWRDVVAVLRAVGPKLDDAYLGSVEIGELRTLLDRARNEAEAR